MQTAQFEGPTSEKSALKLKQLAGVCILMALTSATSYKDN